MTAIDCLRILRKGFLVLIVWNLILTGTLLVQFSNNQQKELNQQICNLEAIPPYEIIEEF